MNDGKMFGSEGGLGSSANESEGEKKKAQILEKVQKFLNPSQSGSSGNVSFLPEEKEWIDSYIEEYPKKRQEIETRLEAEYQREVEKLGTKISKDVVFCIEEERGAQNSVEGVINGHNIRLTCVGSHQEGNDFIWKDFSGTVDGERMNEEQCQTLWNKLAKPLSLRALFNKKIQEEIRELDRLNLSLQEAKRKLESSEGKKDVAGYVDRALEDF